MTDALPFLKSDEMLFVERSTDPGTGIQRSKIREPILNKTQPVTGNQPRQLNTSNNYQFNLPKTGGYLVNYNNSSAGYLEFSVSATSSQASANAGTLYDYLQVEPWRLFKQPEIRVNGTLLNPDDTAAQIRMTQDLMDKPIEWAASSDGASIGLDVNQGFKVNPFLSSQAAVLNNVPRLSESQIIPSAIGGAGVTGNISNGNSNAGFFPVGGYGETGALAFASNNFGATGMPFISAFSVDSTPAILNGVVPISNPSSNFGDRYTRFRVPLSLISGGCCIGDPNSLLPLRYLDSVSLTLWPNTNQQWCTYKRDVMSDTSAHPGSTGIGANGIVTPIPLTNIQIYISDMRLCFYTVEIDAEIDAMYRALLQEAKFYHKTQVCKMQSWTSGNSFGGYGQQGRISFNTSVPAMSARSVEVCMVCPPAIESAYSGWKSTMLDNGIYQYIIKIDGESYPIMSDFCWNGYQNDDVAYPACYQEAYTAYSNYRRSKLSSEYLNYFNMSSLTTPWVFSGYGQLYPYNAPNVDGGPSDSDGKPMRAGYPLAAACISGNVEIDGNPINASMACAPWYPLCQRSFRMVADLTSLNHDDSLWSGRRVNTVDFTALYNGLRNYYFTSAAYTPTAGTVTIPQPQDCTNIEFWIVVRANQLLQLSRLQCRKYD